MTDQATGTWQKRPLKQANPPFQYISMSGAWSLARPYLYRFHERRCGKSHRPRCYFASAQIRA